ncbi:hypothetical protein [Paenibacillus donghaensis]|uniref:hypothetical protein n=1 Tax=Paenibacillus donghaensis TaxID=414771 RepID=UPI001FE3C2DF|nr:hypothetical protein [Paenibacillus donghaensis]
MSELHKPVYIPSVEGSDIYNYMFRGRDFEVKYIGMIPSSLELNKLIDTGLKTIKKKTNQKFLSTDIINVKFKQKVDSGQHIIKKISAKIEKLDETKIEYKDKLKDFVALIESELKEDKWKGVSYKELREKLYLEGFVYNGVRYVVYKRSSAKSRIGQCLFIREKLHKPMIKWSRMNFEFKNRRLEDEIDFPSLLAYESLVGSSIESTININPNNILMVKDVESIFTKTSNVVRTGANKYLDSFTEESKIKNSLFDGESLLDASYFEEGKSMMLLRNHMFKSAAFNCKIQKFLTDNCPEGIDYNEWKISSMYDGEEIFAKDIHLITTPSSLKALKFHKILGSEKKMWQHWKRIVILDECVFGVCKSEKKSKLGFDNEGKLIQQTSYQMLNSLPMKKEDVEKFTRLEKGFIERLKNDDDFFVAHIRSTNNDMNSNEMFADLYDKNNDIAKTKIFRTFRKKIISGHVTHIKNGKVRLSGDYCVMLGNPMEFLYHAIGGINVEDPEVKALNYNEVYTTMFDEKEITGFRNPHTSPNNVLLAVNKKVNDIDKYFNLTSNIVCVNAIGFPLQDILSGCDYDSDTVLLIDDENLLTITKSLFGKYNVCINQVKSSKKHYTVCNKDMATIDNELSNSQKYIGRTVNTGQLCMSSYWDLLHKGKSEEELSDLMKKLDVVTVLSGICIDLAKKMFEININKEIEHICQIKELKKEKPLFWQYVNQGGEITTVKYDCPMDLLFEEMTDLDYADKRANIPFNDFLVKRNMSDSLRNQESKVFGYVENMVSKINNTYAKHYSEEERDRRIDDIIKYYSFYVRKLQINEDTMYSLLIKLTKNKKDKIASRLLNVLHSTQKRQFLDAFSVKNDTL